MFFKIKKHTIFFLLLTLFIIPMHVFAYSDYIIASGENIGIELNSNGIIIVGTYEINGTNPARDANLKIGDKIISVNDIPVSSIDNMLDVIEQDDDQSKIKVSYKRGNTEYNTNLNLVFDDKVYKTGLYVKDSINGVGTLTYIDPNTLLFGALGHEIIEKTTGQKLEIKDGKIYSSSVVGINPSTDGNPGEKEARYDTSEVFGSISKNTSYGIFGNYSSKIDDEKLYKVATPTEIDVGDASILTVVNGEEVSEFAIKILKVSSEEKDAKNILFEVIDEDLLELTGGIIQGMSGSPIIQNDKIIGAITHVVVDDCTKGYGIFITNMLEEAES